MFYGGEVFRHHHRQGTDFVALAEAFSAMGIRVTKPEEVDVAFEGLASQTGRW